MAKHHTKTKLCALCSKKTELKESHIVPKFIFRWLKTTSGLKLRGLSNINVKVQDGPKLELLCGACEITFGKLENQFSRNIFKPFVKGNLTVINYDRHFFRFIASVFWRALAAGNEVFNPCKEPRFQPLLDSARDGLRKFLNEESSSISHQIHMLAGVELYRETPDIEVPDGAILYFGRGVDISMLESDKKLFLYLKLPRFIFLLPLLGMDEKEYQGTQVLPSGGRIDVELSRITDQDFGNFIFETLEIINEIKAKMSLNQREKMINQGQQNWNNIKNLDLGIILEHQEKLKRDNGDGSFS